MLNLKRFTALVLLAGGLVAGRGLAQTKAQPHDPNPTHDADVQRGYDKHQQEHSQKEAERREAHKDVPCCEIKISGDTPHIPINKNN